MSSPAHTTRRIHRFENGGRLTLPDAVAVEEPLEIRINNRPLTVTMRTPGEDSELASGFLFAEGIIRSAKDIAAIEPHPRNRHGNVLNILTTGDTSIDWARLKAHFATTSSCGLCGRESVAAIRRRVPRIRSDVRVDARVLGRLPGKLRSAQDVFTATGGLHAAGLFDLRGRLLVLREDIGRHNAVDKVLGWGVLHGRLPFERRILVVSGRASFEIVQKALAARVPVLGAISAASSLAIDLAAAGGMTLIGFLREGSMNLYSGSRRVKA